MRSTSLSIEGLFINRLPNVFLIIFTIIVIAVWLIISYNKIRHKKGTERFVKFVLVPICFGIFLIALGYVVSLTALKYTHGTEETTATVVSKEVDRDYRHRNRRATKYIYTVRYIDNEEVKRVKLQTTLARNIDVGDNISVYYVPDDNNDSESFNHTVVAVDFEKSYADIYITLGMASALFGLCLLVFLKIKEDSINKGIRTTAKVLQITPVDSKLFKNNKNYDFICQGRNPVTQMITTFTTVGRPSDFTMYDPQSEVTVMVSRENPKKYFISL